MNPTGIWDITDTVNGKPVTEVALIADGKYFSLASADEFGCTDIRGGTYTINGSMFTGSGVAIYNCKAPNGQGVLPYTFSGYLTGTDLNLSFDADGMLVPTLGATMDPLYNEPSSLAKLAGNWDDAGNTLTINPDGTFFEQQASGCVVNGAYTIIDPNHNLYRVSVEITNCSSNLADIPFTGLGYLDDSNPNAWHFLEDLSGPDPALGGAINLAFDNIGAAATEVSLASVANIDGIVSNGSAVANGGLDGYGNAYSANLLGTSLTWNGNTYAFGSAGTVDAADSVTIPLPLGNYSTLTFLGTGVDGNQASQTFTVNYSDGSSTSFVQSLSDWFTPQNYPGESKALTMAYRVESNGALDNRTFYLYGYSFTLNSELMPVSLTLPDNYNVIVLAVDVH